jgi:hypothetical protein
MAAVVTCTGVGALAVVLWPEPEVAVLDFDSADFDYPEFDLVGKPEGEATNDGVAAAGDDDDGGKARQSGTAPSPRPSKPNVDKFQGGGYAGADAGSAADGLKDDGVAEVDDGPRGTRGGTEAAAGPSEVDGIDGPKTQTGGLGLDLGPQVQRRGEVLTDADAIRQMIGKLMAQNIPRLKQCYERQLKRDPELAGRWLIKYTVTKDGQAVNASASGRDRSNAELETCMAQVIEAKWRFDRIVRDQPVQKTLTFRPG